MKYSRTVCIYFGDEAFVIEYYGFHRKAPLVAYVHGYLFTDFEEVEI